MYVCICAAVSEPEVRECILAGARTAEDIGDRCAAGTGCGSCVERLGMLVAEMAGEVGAPERVA
ncbi:(2Fe-2S)-binding protein [Gandjariella thermophila]|uniref:Bacterioferritin-associated ferredoxin n=1 Tax=Gandjariella thermophila TaxID=1931992 RepID=A0A4D4J4Q3_9PSEU|nr:(2Fe-2S)-binding protein [Gandjariella thermophila]GDY31501.1 hypothetical protein GTS_31340 [Gandjariella thermophila]